MNQENNDSSDIKSFENKVIIGWLVDWLVYIISTIFLQRINSFFNIELNFKFEIVQEQFSLV